MDFTTDPRPFWMRVCDRDPVLLWSVGLVNLVGWVVVALIDGRMARGPVFAIATSVIAAGGGMLLFLGGTWCLRRFSTYDYPPNADWGPH